MITFITLAVLFGAIGVFYAVTRPEKDEWLPCWSCKRVWQEDEDGRVHYYEPLVWTHPALPTDSLCPECRYRALRIVKAIEQEAM